MTLLDWQTASNQLTLRGELTRETLLSLWSARSDLLRSEVDQIDVTALQRVDSAGLALLIHFLNEKKPARQLVGITDKLQTLMTLYNLKQVINDKY